MSSRFDGDVQVTGMFQAGTNVLTASSVSDKHVVANANIQAGKLIHRYRQAYHNDSPVIETKCIHVVQSSQGATINSCVLGARVIDPNVSDDVNIVIDVLMDGTSIMPLNIPLAILPANHVPPLFSPGTYYTGKVVQSNPTYSGTLGRYFRLTGVTGSYSTDPNLDSGVGGHWSQVSISTMNTVPPATLGYMSPDLAVSSIEQFDWIDVAVVSIFGGTPVGSVASAAVLPVTVGTSNTTTIYSANSLVQGQTYTFTGGTAGNIGKSFTVTSTTGASPYTVTGNLATSPVAGDTFSVGSSTTTVIYTAAGLTTGFSYTMASGPQIGRVFNPTAAITGGYVVTSNMTAGPNTGDTFGLGVPPQGLYVCLEIDESPLP